MIYRCPSTTKQKPQIVHYGPFAINQISEASEKPWVIVINEREIKTISPQDAASGAMQVWKLALWGTYKDKRTLELIRNYFSHTLEQYCSKMGWGDGFPREGAQLRDKLEDQDNQWVKANLKGGKIFDTKAFVKIKPRFRYSLPDDMVLKKITSNPYIRTGKKTLYLTTPAPHVIISAGWQNFAVFSDKDFVVPPRQMVISAPRQPLENETFLKALTVYLSSSLVAYYLFFQVPEWGVARRARLVVTREVRNIPTPNLSISQARELANVHQEIVTKEKMISQYVTDTYARMYKLGQGAQVRNKLELYKSLSKQDKHDVDIYASRLQTEIRQLIDEKIFELFEIPKDIQRVVWDFVNNRLPLDKASTRKALMRRPTIEELRLFALQLRDELDGFTMGESYHRVSVTLSEELIECIVEITECNSSIPITDNSIKTGNQNITDLLNELSKKLRDQVSQWVYIQRGLRLFDGPRICIYRPPRAIDWTINQAVEDAADIIGTLVSTES